VTAYPAESGGSTRVSTDLQVHKARWTGFQQYSTKSSQQISLKILHV